MENSTNIEQSLLLSKILPIETADMYWENNEYKRCGHAYIDEEDDSFSDTPAWSLSALLGCIADAKIDGNELEKYLIMFDCDEGYWVEVFWYDKEQNAYSKEFCNQEFLIDAVVDCIKWLYKK